MIFTKAKNKFQTLCNFYNYFYDAKFLTIKIFIMRKHLLGVALLLSCSVMMSSTSHISRVERDDGVSKLYSTDQKPVVLSSYSYVAMPFINDAVVPVVQLYPVNHIASIQVVTGNHSPARQAMIRGPTTDKTILSPSPREKPVIA